VIPPANEFPLHDLRFERNTIHGGFKSTGVNGLTLDGNQFLGTKPELENTVLISKDSP
jgi:hypothetical protein